MPLRSRLPEAHPQRASRAGPRRPPSLPRSPSLGELPVRRQRGPLCGAAGGPRTTLQQAPGAQRGHPSRDTGLCHRDGHSAGPHPSWHAKGLLLALFHFLFLLLLLEEKWGEAPLGYTHGPPLTGTSPAEPGAPTRPFCVSAFTHPSVRRPMCGPSAPLCPARSNCWQSAGKGSGLLCTGTPPPAGRETVVKIIIQTHIHVKRAPGMKTAEGTARRRTTAVTVPRELSVKGTGARTEHPVQCAKMWEKATEAEDRTCKGPGATMK